MQIFLYILAGLAGGLIGGMGMGGGTLLIPILTLFLDIEQKTAQAINLVSFIPMAIVAVIIHSKNKLVSFKEALWIIVPALVTTVICSIVVTKINADSLRKYFGIFLTALGIILLISQAVGLWKKHSKKSLGKIENEENSKMQKPKNYK
ncbi:MAG: sulfite exporter TauE/SafE family protein [Clostridia bacterium]